MKKRRVKAKTIYRKRSKHTSATHLVNLHLVVFSLAMFAVGIFLGIGQLENNKYTCADTGSCITDYSGKYTVDRNGVFMGQKVYSPPPLAELIPEGRAVLGANTASRHIYIDLTNQKLLAFEGNNLIYNFTVATGWWNKTPTGDFNIWIKMRYATMIGGDKAKGDYYNLPNVPFTMYFYNAEHPKWEGYGIHDAYWLQASDFGHPRSHGCINMQLSDAQALYNWASPQTSNFTTFATDANPGTPVTIYGVTPTHYN